MNVHIVCSDTTSDRIVARLARMLATGNGWTLGKEPDPSAELNVFFPYLEWRKTKWDKTPTIGWFTHREDTVPAKARIWDETAPMVDVRVTSALKYARDLDRYGRTYCASLPVDCDKFVIGDRPDNERPVIGVAGYVYPGGRKGQGMVARLAQEYPEWDVVASGEGWPIETVKHDWADMPCYYQGLDVFLCTSLIEGGPVTVLEALACGVPVVVPWGVGHCDDLDYMPGIYRYPMGAYEEMVEQIAYAIELSYDSAELRESVAYCTADEWAGSWGFIVDQFLAPLQRVIVTVAYGERARACAIELIAHCAPIPRYRLPSSATKRWTSPTLPSYESQWTMALGTTRRLSMTWFRLIGHRCSIWTLTCSAWGRSICSGSC